MSWELAASLGFGLAVQLGAIAYAAGRITARLEALEAHVAVLLQRPLEPAPARGILRRVAAL